MTESAASLRALAQRCRQLAGSASMENVALSLKQIAADYEQQAARAAQREAEQSRRPDGAAPGE